MARHHGRNGSVQIGANSLGCIRDWTFTESASLVDATCAGDAGEVLVDGIPSGSGSMTVVFDNEDTQQPLFVPGATLSVELYQTSGSFLAMDIIVEDRTDGISHTAEVTSSWNFRSSGGVTRTVA
ncbi:MAG: hypothetical protein AAF416_18135 [Pseudomonadota bacterium]